MSLQPRPPPRRQPLIDSPSALLERGAEAGKPVVHEVDVDTTAPASEPKSAPRWLSTNAPPLHTPPSVDVASAGTADEREAVRRRLLRATSVRPGQSPRGLAPELLHAGPRAIIAPRRPVTSPFTDDYESEGLGVENSVPAAASFARDAVPRYVAPAAPSQGSAPYAEASAGASSPGYALSAVAAPLAAPPALLAEVRRDRAGASLSSAGAPPPALTVADATTAAVFAAWQDAAAELQEAAAAPPTYAAPRWPPPQPDPILLRGGEGTIAPLAPVSSQRRGPGLPSHEVDSSCSDSDSSSSRDGYDDDDDDDVEDEGGSAGQGRLYAAQLRSRAELAIAAAEEARRATAEMTPGQLALYYATLHPEEAEGARMAAAAAAGAAGSAALPRSHPLQAPSRPTALESFDFDDDDDDSSSAEESGPGGLARGHGASGDVVATAPHSSPDAPGAFSAAAAAAGMSREQLALYTRTLLATASLPALVHAQETIRQKLLREATTGGEAGGGAAQSSSDSDASAGSRRRRRRKAGEGGRSRHRRGSKGQQQQQSAEAEAAAGWGVLAGALSSLALDSFAEEALLALRRGPASDAVPGDAGSAAAAAAAPPPPSVVLAPPPAPLLRLPPGASPRAAGAAWAPVSSGSSSSGGGGGGGAFAVPPATARAGAGSSLASIEKQLVSLLEKELGGAALDDDL